MKVFELHFNLKKKTEEIFDSFVFEPESASEKRLGNLYMIGKFAKILPQNAKFLNSLSRSVKQEYYQTGKLTESLKKANEFLNKEARSGNVNWLGNLHFGVLSLAPYKNCWAMNFSKAGDVKILLARKGELLDIGQNLEIKEIEPYPLKLFGNVVTGRVFPDDKIILLTKEVFSLLWERGGFLNRLKNVSEEKELKKLLKENKKLLSEATGICLLLMITGKPAPVKKISKQPAVKRPNLKLPSPSPLNKLLRKKSVILIIALLLILLTGSVIFGFWQKKQEETQLIMGSEQLRLAEEKINEAERLLILHKVEEASSLISEAKNIIAQFEGEEADSLQKSIQELLDIINGG